MCQSKWQAQFHKKFYGSEPGALEVRKDTTFQKGFSPPPPLNKQNTQNYVEMLFIVIFM